MAGAGSVAWLFEPKGLIVVSTDKAQEEELMEIAIEAGAEDFSPSGNVFEIIAEPQEFEAVRQAIEAKNIPMESCELTRIPKNQVSISEVDVSKILKLIDKIEDNDDVQNVYANFEIPDDMVEDA